MKKKEIKEDDIVKDITMLQEYSELMNDEVGEAYALLVNMWSRGEFISKTFLNALRKEITSTAKYLRKNSTIVEVEEPAPTHPLKYREVKFKND